MNRNKRKTAMLLALCIVLPIAALAINNLIGGSAEGVTHSSDAGAPMLVNTMNAKASISGAGCLGAEGANGAGARIYIGFYDPVEPPVCTSAREWNRYR